jgi:hypothetical protein
LTRGSSDQNIDVRVRFEEWYFSLRREFLDWRALIWRDVAWKWIWGTFAGHGILLFLVRGS